MLGNGIIVKRAFFHSKLNLGSLDLNAGFGAAA
jgi:hypothetical protein